MSSSLHRGSILASQGKIEGTAHTPEEATVCTWTSELKQTLGPPGYRSSPPALCQKLSGPYPKPHAPLAGSQKVSLAIRKRQQLAQEKDPV